MKKKLFGIGMIAMLVLSQIVCVSARSKETYLQPTGESAGRYAVSEVSEENMEQLTQKDAQAANAINKINNGEASVGVIADYQTELKAQLKGARMLTPLINIVPLDGGLKLDNGNYLLHLSFPGLTSMISDLRVLYYNAAQKIWEIITPSDIDWDNKVVTMEVKDMSDLSFMSMVAKAESSDENNEPGNENTDNTTAGDTNNDKTNNTTDNGSTNTSDTNSGNASTENANTGTDTVNTNGTSGGSSTQNSTTGTTGSVSTAASGSAVGESPKTGVTSDWMLWTGAAGVLLVVSAAALKKSRQK